MDRLVFGMHHLNITQAGTVLDGKQHYSHPNAAIDLAGEDSGIDYWYNKESETYFYCSGYFGNRSTGNTRFFVTCDQNGQKKKILCADGKERVITLALTHSGKDYQLYHVYKPGDILYQEGTAGRATGNHIHLEVAEGSQKTKYWDVKMKVYRMMGEMDPRNAFFILDGYTKVVNTQGLIFKHCSKVNVEEEPMGLGFKVIRPKHKRLLTHTRKTLTQTRSSRFLHPREAIRHTLNPLAGSLPSMSILLERSQRTNSFPRSGIMSGDCMIFGESTIQTAAPIPTARTSTRHTPKTDHSSTRKRIRRQGSR